MPPILRKRKQKDDELPYPKKNKPDDDKNYFPKKEPDEENDEEPDEEPDEESDEEFNEDILDDEIHIDKNEKPEAYNNLLAIKKEIYRTEPNVETMLITPMRLEDRAQLC
jgi:hypothetical protein